MKIGWMLYLQEESEIKAHKPIKKPSGIYCNCPKFPKILDTDLMKQDYIY